MKAIEVHMTAPDAAKAAEIGHALVKEGLAACLNIVPGLRSIFVWNGQVCDEPEVLCVIKTRRELWEKLCQRVKELHPYDVPELLAFEVEEGSAQYLAWVEASTRMV